MVLEAMGRVWHAECFRYGTYCLFHARVRYLHPHLAGNALSNNTFIIACFNALALYMFLLD